MSGYSFEEITQQNALGEYESINISNDEVENELNIHEEELGEYSKLNNGCNYDYLDSSSDDEELDLVTCMNIDGGT